jgi:2-hydroxy-6-oxonona-2,4-dienedioate hydrolase
MDAAANPKLQALASQAGHAGTPCGDGVVAWRRWGAAPAASAPVVLLHGGSGSWTHWLHTVEPLVLAGRTVLVPDMPGFGESAAPPDGHDADVLPGWLERGLVQLIGHAPVELVGFSFGALVAGLWAHAQGARVARLVLVGSPGLSAAPAPVLDLRRWEAAEPGAARLAVHRHNLLQLMLAREEAASELAVALHAHNVERDRMRRRRLMLTDALVPLLPALRCPVHGIWGREDVLFRHRLEVVERGMRLAPGLLSLDFIDGAGHWVAFEQPEAFNRALLRALGMPGPSGAPGDRAVGPAQETGR